MANTTDRANRDVSGVMESEERIDNGSPFLSPFEKRPEKPDFAPKSFFFSTDRIRRLAFGDHPTPVIGIVLDNALASSFASALVVAVERQAPQLFGA